VVTSASGQRFVGHLHWALVDDVVILLDDHRGEYFGLDAETSGRWLRLSAAFSEEGFDDLIEAARRRGWLAASSPDFGPRQKNRSHVTKYVCRISPAFGAYVCLVRAYLLVRVRGFPSAYNWARSRGGNPSPSASRPAEIVRAVRAFVRAEHFIISRLGPDDCLPRSLALYVFLRSRGIPVCHRIGVRRYPFSAHAWVEHQADLILDWPERVSGYTPISVIS
jgi:Transglutaminase-like superfamily